MNVAVVGAGVLGTLTTLHAAPRVGGVDLVDATPELWSGASSTGEGKIHLGYVYGRGSDQSIRTLLDAAGRFAPDLEAALGRPLPWPELVSSRFRYLVARASTLSPAEFEVHGHRVAELSRELHGERASYLGEAGPGLLPRRLDEDDRGTTYDTPERAVDVPRLREAVGSAIAGDDRIRHLARHRVVDVEAVGDGWRLGVDTPDGRTTLGPYRAVVNCTWEQAPTLDRLAGHDPGASPNLRLRAFLHGRSDGDPLAVTVTHGPFGDMVRFPGGRTYASWYPGGLLGFLESTDVPPEWHDLQAGPLRDPELVQRMVDGLADLVPEVRSLEDVTAHARVVVARGSTDIDDPASGLHDRAGADVLDRGGWISVRSTKFTTAPMMARRAAEVAGARA